MTSITALAVPISASSSPSPAPKPRTLRLPIISSTIRTAASSAVLLTATAAALLSSKPLPSLACTTADQTTEQTTEQTIDPAASPLTDTLNTLLYTKLQSGDDPAALAILRQLISSQPANTDWKLLAARLHHEMDNPAEARALLEQILAQDPLSFEALFQNAVLMDQTGEGPAVISRLERALEVAVDQGQEKAARDVRLIMAQIQFLQKDVDGAIASYEALAEEDSGDYRPFFCRGVIYSLLGRDGEAREMFRKYHELSPKKFEVDAYEQTPLSRTRLFGTEDSRI